MNGSLVLWITLALSIFWGVGVYNRLMRMRARGVAALGSVEKHLRQYTQMVREQVLEAGRTPMGWEQLLSDLHTLDHALKDAKPNVLTSEALARLGQAYDGLQRDWRCLQELPVDLAGPVVPMHVKRQWDVLTLRVDTARGGCNQILMKYNEALSQFPAKLVAGAMGFRPAGIL